MNTYLPLAAILALTLTASSCTKKTTNPSLDYGNQAAAAPTVSGSPAAIVNTVTNSVPTIPITPVDTFTKTDCDAGLQPLPKSQAIDCGYSVVNKERATVIGYSASKQSMLVGFGGKTFEASLQDGKNKAVQIVGAGFEITVKTLKVLNKCSDAKKANHEHCEEDNYLVDVTLKCDQKTKKYASWFAADGC